jgi:hypothetical protein
MDRFTSNVHLSHPGDRPHRNRILNLVQRGGAIAFFMLLAACGTSTTPSDQASESPAGESPAATGDGLKIGTLLPLTGDLAQYGKPMQESVDLLVAVLWDNRLL